MSIKQVVEPTYKMNYKLLNRVTTINHIMDIGNETHRSLRRPIYIETSKW